MPVIPSSMQTREIVQGTSTSVPFPTLPRRKVIQVSSTTLSDFLRGTYFHQTTLVTPKLKTRLELSLETSTEASIRINQDTRDAQSQTETLQTEEHSHMKVIETEV